MKEGAQLVHLSPFLAPLILASCSDIQTRTYKVELSDDPTPHLVELYREIEASKPTRIFAYSLEFPQNYYAYRDNHQHVKQTKIGLILDRATLGPIAPVIVAEAAKPQYTSNYILPERLLDERYRTRALMVTIVGMRADQRIRRPSSASEPLSGDPHFRWSSTSTLGNPGSGEAVLTGYSVSDPLVRATCPRAGGDCTVEIQYLTSRVRFNWPQDEIARAVPVARRLMAILAEQTRRQGG